MIPILDRTISLADLSFHYREAGESIAPPVILLHGLGRRANDWDEVMLVLAKHYHVLALDQRGHGTSARAEYYSFEAMRDDLKTFVDTLSIDTFTLIGHSMGGTVAFLFTEMWPERVVRLIIEDTPPPFVSTVEPTQQLPAIPEEPPMPVSYDWRLVEPIMHQLHSPDPAWWENLATIPVPTLIIGGGSTSHVPQEKLAEVAHLVPDCRLVTIEGAGHSIHRNRLSEYLEILKGFLF